MSYMVYICVKTPVDLVSGSYYKEELAYQQVIDGTRRANALSQPVDIKPNQDGILVQLPREMKGKPVDGSITFYCPSDASRDRKITLHPDADGVQMIGTGVVPAGHFTVKVDWKADGIDYYTERPLELQKNVN